MSLNIFMGEEDPVGVNLIDISQLTIATLSTNFKPEEHVSEEMLRHLIIDTVRANIARHRGQYPNAIVCVDNSKNGYWRRDIAYYYKKHREKDREKSARDWDSIFTSIYKIIDELIEYYPAKIIKVDRTEADDIIGVLTKHFALQDIPVLISSGDGDFTQLHKHGNVKQWSPPLKKFVKAKHGTPYADLMYKIIKGDKKDCVAPIKCRSDYYLTHIEGERAPACTEKWMNELIQAEDPEMLLPDELKDRYRENRSLLDFDYIPDHIVAAIMQAYENVKPAPRGKLYSYFVKNRLVKLLGKINEF